VRRRGSVPHLGAPCRGEERDGGRPRGTPPDLGWTRRGAEAGAARGEAEQAVEVWRCREKRRTADLRRAPRDTMDGAAVRGAEAAAQYGAGPQAT
jgi:hypothetical protein